MSVKELKRLIKEDVLDVLDDDLRPYLNAAVQEFEINKEKTIANLTNYTKVGPVRAEKIFKDIIMLARSQTRKKGSGWSSVTREDFKSRTPRTPYKPFTFRFDREYRLDKPNVPLKSRYGAIAAWKRDVVTPYLKDKYKHLDPDIENFSSDFHLGHGPLDTKKKGGRTSLAAVGYRQEESVRRLRSRKNEAAEKMISTILKESSLLNKVEVISHVNSWYDANTRVRREYTVYLDFQWGASNIKQGRDIEGRSNQKLKALFNDLLRDKRRLENWAFYTKTSTPLLKYIDKAIDNAVLGKKTKKERSSAKAKQSLKGKVSKGRLVSPPVTQRPRNAKGQFTSPINIQAILDNRIKEQVADNMGEGGALVYRTGRFASSVSVEKVMQSRQGTLTAYYTYMKAPYQTFERGFKQGSLRRDPRKLISRSIREIAMETLSHKLHIRTRRV